MNIDITNPLNLQVGTVIEWSGGNLYTVAKIERGSFYLNSEFHSYPYEYRLSMAESYCRVVSHPVQWPDPAPVAAPVITVKPSLTPQAATVLRHIKRAGSITQRSALLDHSVQSLTKAISIINAAGHKTTTTFKRHPLTDQRYAEYSLAA